MAARVTVTLKLQPGVDDDLILWWQSLPKGKRQSEVKRRLRAVLHLSEPQTTLLENTLRQVTAEIQAMQQMLTKFSGFHPLPEKVEGERGEPPSLSPDAKQRRGRKIAQSQW